MGYASLALGYIDTLSYTQYAIEKRIDYKLHPIA